MRLFLIALLCFFHQQVFSQDFSAEILDYRVSYQEDFRNNPKAPINPENLIFMDFYDPDISFRVKAKVKPSENAEPFEIPTSSGKTKTFQSFAIATFKMNGKKHQLTLYRNLTLGNNPIYQYHLFLPFKDLTNGSETYGGGRYLDVSMTDIKGKKLIIDFNKAYNPYCSYSAGYNCPIPPKENHLETAITAGEKNYTGPYREETD